MEPFEPDQLSDGELDDLLRKWEAPAAPVRLRAAVFPETVRPWWQRVWQASIRIPAPVALALAMVIALAIRRWPANPPPQVVTKTEKVEVPVIQERVVTRTVYRDRASAPDVDVETLRPVAELRPVIIRRANAQN